MRSFTEDDDPKDVIVPLAAGNYWVYIDSIFSMNGFYVDTSRLVITGSTKIYFENQILDVFFWNWIDPETGAPQCSKWLNRNELEGLWDYGVIGKTDTLLAKVLEIMYPITIGQSWKTVMLYENFTISDTIELTCIGTDLPFFTPKKVLNCYVYHYNVPLHLKKDFNKLSSTHSLTFPFLKSDRAQMDGHEMFLYFVPNLGFAGYIETIHGFPVWKKALLDYFIHPNE